MTETDPEPDAPNDGPAQTDPLVGVQRETDAAAEDAGTPDEEVTLREAPSGKAARSRTVAGILAIFLGGLGVHRFYLGYKAIGAFQLILFAAAVIGTLIVGIASGADNYSLLLANGLLYGSIVPIWGVIEGICIFFGALNRDAQNRPLA
ncbi:MAG: TM2 domain-containing protein [Phycisphaeraceae bacterium]|nr:TM2 domain-containing protein [Phycisphaeraceae bacterium]